MKFPVDKIVSLLILIVAALSACTSSLPKMQVATPEQLASSKGYSIVEVVKGIRNYHIDGWNTVSNTALIIHGGVSERYLVTLRRRCIGLSMAEFIATSSTAKELTRFDTVIFKNGSEDFRENCAIKKIYRLQKMNHHSNS